MSDLISRQDAINEILKEVDKEYKNSGYIIGADDAVDIIKSLPSATPNCSEFPNNWIPVSERLPEEFKNVLLCTDGDVIFIGWSYSWNDDYAFDDDNGLAWENDVVAWMPLPEPYQPKEEG